jgi:uncharacterized membrane protein YhhN
MPSRRTLAATAGYAALATVDTVLASKSTKAARRARYLVKPLLMPALRTAFLEATPGRYDRLKRTTATAEAFSWGGDVALLGSGDRAFLAGVGSFFGAHLAYITGFSSVRQRPLRLDSSGVKAAAGLFLTAAPVLGLAARRKSPELALPVVGYAGVLAAMFATSTMLDPTIDPRARRTIQAGTTLFLVSDSILAVQKFLLNKEHPALEAAVMATYTAGQGLIAGGVAHR